MCLVCVMRSGRGRIVCEMFHSNCCKGIFHHFAIYLCKKCKIRDFVEFIGGCPGPLIKGHFNFELHILVTASKYLSQQ